MTIDLFSTQVAFLIFEAVFCFLSALVYSFSKDTLYARKSVVLSLNISCGLMLMCEYLFYAYDGSTDRVGVVIMYVVNAAVYYFIDLLLLFYAMLVAVRLFGKFNLRRDMPCRKRFIAVSAIVILGLFLVTFSQFNHIYYSFDENNFYQREPLFWLSTAIPMLGALLVVSIIIQYRRQISTSQLLVMISYLVLPLMGGLIQIFFYGFSLLNICIGFSVLLMFFENMIHKEQEVIQASKTEIRTGLANEHGYVEWLNSMKGKQQLKEYAVVFFDLRKFSDINRKYGIENGNRILAAFGNILQGKIEKDEILGRQYGNRFVAIVRQKNLVKLLNVLKEIDVPFDDVNTDQKNHATLSARAGVYMIDRTDLAGEDILIFAGQALSAAKSKDNEDVVWLTQELIDAIAQRKKLESDIRTGLKAGEFKPYYQPKVNIDTGKLCGAEALSRWHHDGKVIFPGGYIPNMESNDTICLLDFCILEAVCKDIAGWLEAGFEVPPVSVNFSRRNLIDSNLALRVDNVVTKAGIPKNLIEIEVTESSDEFSIGVLGSFVDSLHELGYKVAIDDFGSASSSLTLLREVSFDTLKIDKGFVDHAKTKDQTILTHMVKLSDEIGVDIVAEGVEQESQINILRGLGVDVLQGFYFDKPLSKEDLTKRLGAPEYTVPKEEGSGAVEVSGGAMGEKEMDYKAFLSQFRRLACVVSVNLDKEGEDRYHVLEANDEYKKTVVDNIEDFVPDVPYTRYIQKAANFESLSENCVMTERPMHTYFDIELYNAWMEVFYTPLVSKDPKRKLLLFSYEMNPKADVDKLADISAETATHVLKTCLKLRETNDFQDAMNAVIADIRVQCGAKRCSILLTDFEKREYSLLCEDYGNDPNQLPLSAFLREEFYAVIETWPKLMNKSDCYIISNESDMEEAYKIAPDWINSLRRDGVQSIVIFPLRSDNKTIGYIWAGNFDPADTLKIKEILSLTTFILSAEIANEENVRKMKLMSSTDLLTGVFNRNAMNNRIIDEVEGKNPIKKPFGVFFIDVNGLKTINDTRGHLSGDELLKDVASTLKELCGKNVEIYRVGGDEFMIIAQDMTEDEFEALKESLIRHSERPDRAHFAVGGCHSVEAEDIRKAMQKADARMYERKPEYYERHPEYINNEVLKGIGI